MKYKCLSVALAVSICCGVEGSKIPSKSDSLPKYEPAIPVGCGNTMSPAKIRRLSGMLGDKMPVRAFSEGSAEIFFPQRLGDNEFRFMFNGTECTLNKNSIGELASSLVAIYWNTRNQYLGKYILATCPEEKRIEIVNWIKERGALTIRAKKELLKWLGRFELVYFLDDVETEETMLESVGHIEDEASGTATMNTVNELCQQWNLTPDDFVERSRELYEKIGLSDPSTLKGKQRKAQIFAFLNLMKMIRGFFNDEEPTEE